MPTIPPIAVQDYFSAALDARASRGSEGGCKVSLLGGAERARVEGVGRGSEGKSGAR